MFHFNSRFAHRALIPAMLVATMAASGAHGQALYPRVITDGENSNIDYGPMGSQSAAVGGGRVVVTGSGEDAVIQHFDGQYVQRGLNGMRPVVVGSGESATAVWVPNNTSWTVLAQLGQDSSKPSSADTSLLRRLLTAAR
jgi:hypothetical protein